MKVFILSNYNFEDGSSNDEQAYVHETKEGCKKHFKQLVKKAKKEHYWIEEMKEEGYDEEFSNDGFTYEEKENYFYAASDEYDARVEISWKETDTLE